MVNTRKKPKAIGAADANGNGTPVRSKRTTQKKGKLITVAVRRGSLKELLNMPLEILDMVCYLLNPSLDNYLL